MKTFLTFVALLLAYVAATAFTYFVIPSDWVASMFVTGYGLYVFMLAMGYLLILLTGDVEGFQSSMTVISGLMLMVTNVPLEHVAAMDINMHGTASFARIAGMFALNWLFGLAIFMIGTLPYLSSKTQKRGRHSRRVNRHAIYG